MKFRPQLAASVVLEQIRYPVVASVKLDGVRCLGSGLTIPLLSRSLKPIPNKDLQYLMGELGESLHGWDGELISGDPTAPDCYRRTVSQVMTQEGGTGGVVWWLFDSFLNPEIPWMDRWITLPYAAVGPHIKLLPQVHVNSETELLAFEEDATRKGYEGLILRDPMARYKYGRSTIGEGIMLKLKRFVDDEATVTDFEEQLHNANIATTDERGYTKRSSHQDRKLPTGVLGALVVEWRGSQLRIGTGFTAEDRARIWQDRDDYRGRLVKFKYLPVGMKDLPRHPVFLGWRDARDT